MKKEYDFSEAERGKFHVGKGPVRVPGPAGKPDWAGPKGGLGQLVVVETKRILASQEAQPGLDVEPGNDEHGMSDGGHAHRLLFELVQNSADALRDVTNGASILVRLVGDCLYCADDGRPIDKRAVVRLMSACNSGERNTPALGPSSRTFKSIFRVSNSPEFYSRSGSFRLRKALAGTGIERAAPAVPGRLRVLHLPEPVDPDAAQAKDEELGELMSWATNVVRLPLRRGVREGLVERIRDFPPEFLLFAAHVRYLTLEQGETSRSFGLRDHQGELSLDTGRGVTRWRCFKTSHRLSENARGDNPAQRDGDEVLIRWAAPLDKPTEPGLYWAAMPTNRLSFVAGILNAPWKTTEDCQNLVDGPYNQELYEAAAKMVAHELPRL